MADSMANKTNHFSSLFNELVKKCEHYVSTEAKIPPQALEKSSVYGGFNAYSKPVVIIRTLPCIRGL